MRFPFAVEKDAAKHFKERAASLLSFNEIRAMQIMETLQYGFLYALLGFFIGAGLDTAFPRFDEKKSAFDVMVEATGQALCFIVLIFYLRKVVKLVPFLFVLQWDINGDGKLGAYRPYKTMEYSGEITVGLVLISSQINLLKKIDLLSRELYTRFMGLTHRVESIF